VQDLCWKSALSSFTSQWQLLRENLIMIQLPIKQLGE
jgi:hypothetical protein